jgi:hypothetical protein
MQRAAAQLRILHAGLALLSLAGCGQQSTPSRFSGEGGDDVTAVVDRDATPRAFGVCHGHNCHFHSVARLSEDQWQAIVELFAVPPVSAQEERRRIGEAVALVERAVGEQLGTKADRPRAPFVVVDPTQLDCVDESTNSSTVLHMLDNAALLRWHAVGEPAVRGNPLLISIHFTAVAIEKSTNARYAVDSWFYANGVPPVIVPLAAWRDGYDPEKSKAPIAAR